MRSQPKARGGATITAAKKNCRTRYLQEEIVRVGTVVKLNVEPVKDPISILSERASVKMGGVPIKKKEGKDEHTNEGRNAWDGGEGRCLRRSLFFPAGGSRRDPRLWMGSAKTL